jgi:photosystem II stability/assembly factor-like uncharacterized protein
MLFSRRWLMLSASLGLLILLVSLVMVIPLALADGAGWNATGGPLVSGGQVNTLAVDRSNSNVIYAGVAAIETDEGSSTIYRSTDGGANWTPVFTAENQLYALEASSNKIYAGGTTHWDTSPSLFVSSDGGVNWTPVFTFTRPGNWIDIDVHPSDPNIAIAGGRLRNDTTGHYEGLVYKTTDGGATWTEIQKISTAGEDIFVPAVLVHPFNPNLWLAAAFDWSDTEQSTIYRSTDAGATWSAGRVFNEGGVVSLVGHTGQETVFAGIGKSKFSRASSEVVYRSTDGGQNWGQVYTEGGRLGFIAGSNVYLVNEDGSAFYSNNNGDMWSSGGSIDDNAAAFAVAAAPPTGLYVGGQKNGVFKSTDNGATWAIQNNGMWAYPFILDIEIDPQNINKLYVAADCKGGLRSTDGGTSWQQISATFPATNPLPNCIDDFAVDPTNSNIIYGGGEGEKQGGMPVGAIIKSTDGGVSFSPIYVDPLIPNDGRQRIQAIAVAPSSTNIVYAVGENEPNGQDEYGVILRTNNSGQFSWATVLTLPFHSDFFAVAVHPTNSNIVLAGGRDSQSSRRIGIIYRSTDGGNSWQQVMTSTVSNRSTYIASIVFYQANPNIILAADELSRVFRSTDGGDTWTIVKEQDPDYSGQYLAVDPTVPDEIYLGGGLGYVGKSTDGGQTWTDIDDSFRQGTPDELGASALAVASNEAGQTFWASFIELYKMERPFAPKLTVSKTVNVSQAQVGEIVTYTYRITNSGPISVALVTAHDDQLGAITLGSTSLQTDQSTSGVATATILSGYLPGPLANTVVVTGQTAAGVEAVFTATAHVNLIEQFNDLTQPITTADGQLYIPANTLPPEAETLTYVRLSDPTPTAELPADFAGIAFDLKLYNSFGGEITTFADPFTVTIRYNEGELPTGVDENGMAVFYYAGGQWQQIPETHITRDPANNTITIQLDHLTEFALTGKATSDTYLPIILKN